MRNVYIKGGSKWNQKSLYNVRNKNAIYRAQRIHRTSLLFLKTKVSPADPPRLLLLCSRGRDAECLRRAEDSPRSRPSLSQTLYVWNRFGIVWHHLARLEYVGIVVNRFRLT